MSDLTPQPRQSGRWSVQYGERRNGDSGRYVCVSPDGSRRAQFDSKSDAIWEAQRQNGWEPADGSEQTYAGQLAERGIR